MKFWASSEIFAPADRREIALRETVSKILSHELSKSNLENFDVMFRYIPIIMPIDFLSKYKARSVVRKSKRICDCAPQLDYDVIVSGNIREAATEYMRGIESMAQSLRRLSATKGQVIEFLEILSDTLSQVICELEAA